MWINKLLLLYCDEKKRDIYIQTLITIVVKYNNISANNSIAKDYEDKQYYSRKL